MSETPQGGIDLAAYLDHVERSVESGLEANKKMLSNHLDHSDRVIANVAALKNLNDDELLRLALQRGEA